MDKIAITITVTVTVTITITIKLNFCLHEHNVMADRRVLRIRCYQTVNKKKKIHIKKEREKKERKRTKNINNISI